MEDTPRTPRSPKFRHTRELVRIALDQGMTQDEVARLCRTQQSVVSAWASGRAKAREDQVKPLLARYGHRLNRTSSRVYLVQQEPPVPWEETAEGLLVARLLSDPEGYARELMTEDEVQDLLWSCVISKLRPEFVAQPPVSTPRPNGGYRETPSASAQRVPDMPTDDAPRDDDGELAEEAFLPVTAEDLVDAAKRVVWRKTRPVKEAWHRLLAAAKTPYEDQPEDGALRLRTNYYARHHRLVRVEGAPIWRHVVGVVKAVHRREGRNEERIEVKLDPNERWLLHPAGQGGFRLVVQRLRKLDGSDAAEWGAELYRHSHGTRRADDDGRVRSDDDVARWVCEIQGPFDLSELLARVEALLPGAGPHDRASVPWTLRKALVERGYDVPGVDFLPL